MSDQESKDKNLIPENTKLVVFQGSKIRRIYHNEEWYFSIIDVIELLTESSSPSRYWSELKIKITDNEGANQLFDKIERLKLKAADGRMRETDVANTETLFRIIQSIPSPKAEPFKRWLAQVGYERIKEIEDPELAVKRARITYEQKGYDPEWIEKRMRGIQIREELTNEWKERGIEHQKDYAILTAEISKATFGVTPSEHKKLKNLKKENLRDHMTELELLFGMVGEASTKEIAKQNDSQGFKENKEAARQGGEIAGNARKELERKSGQKVVTSSSPVNNNPKITDKS